MLLPDGFDYIGIRIQFFRNDGKLVFEIKCNSSFFFFDSTIFSVDGEFVNFLLTPFYKKR